VEITEVRIKLMDEPGERLKAFCSITFDNCFVIRDLKIIEGQTGPFVAMPSRKLTAHCHQCGMKNHLRAQFCNQCGARQAQDRMPVDADGRAKLYADIAHPINSACRELIQGAVVEEYMLELERAKQPDYVSRYDDFDMDYGSDYRRGPQQSGDARVDAPHDRQPGRPHQARSSGADVQRSRPAQPQKGAPPQREQRESRMPADGFGAGIFPEE
jgi:stage V sporulation protein G